MSGHFTAAQTDALRFTANLPGGDFTAMGWVRRETAGATHTFCSLGQTGGGGVSIWYDGSNNLNYWNGSGGVTIAASQGASVWRFVALKRTGGTLKGFTRDDGSNTWNTASGAEAGPVTEDILTLGSWITSSDYLNGQMRGWLIYDAALTDDAIMAQSMQLRPLVAANLNREIRFVNGADTNDSSGNGFNPSSIEGAISDGASDPTVPETVTEPTFYSSDSNTTAGGSTSTFTSVQPGGGSNRVLVVKAACGSGGPAAPTGVTYNGVALTHLSGSSVTRGFINVDIWYLLDASFPGSAANIVITYAGAHDEKAASYEFFHNVNQTTPWRGGVATVDDDATTNPSLTVSSSATDLVTGVLFTFNNTGITVGAGTSREEIDDVLGFQGFGSSDISGATPTLSWTQGVATDWLMSGGSLVVAAGGDTTAPVLTDPTGANTGTTTANVGATTDEGNGTMYAVVTTSATQPSVAQIKAGQNHTGAAAAWGGSQAVSGTGAQTLGATGLAHSTAYYAHLVHTDAAANDSNRVSSALFETDQIARPDADISDGAWTPSTGGDLYAVIDESSVSDADYISVNSNSECEIGMSVVATPVSGTRTFRYRHSGAANKRLLAKVYDGASLVETFTHDPCPSALTTSSQTIANAIASFADLRIRFETQDATSPPSPSVTYGLIGTGANGSTTVAPSYPTGITAGDYLLAVITSGATNSETPTDSGSKWGSPLATGASTDGTYGVDAGPRRVTVFGCVADGTESGTYTFNITNGGTCRGSIIRFSKSQASYVWDVVAQGGNDSTSGTGFSVTTAAIDWAVGDVAVACVGQRVDSATQSAQSLTATGITFGTRTNRASVAVTTGNDHRHVIDTFAAITSGSGSQAPTWAYTASANVSGGCVIVRLREVPPTEAARVTFAEFEVPEAASASTSSPPPNYRSSRRFRALLRW